MSDIMVLTILKFAGLAIGLAATVWGMTRKTTFEDGEGKKRLTPAGHVAVALALGSFLIAGSSQGFETLAQRVAERNQALEKAEHARREEAKEARDFRNEQRAQRSLDLQLINRAEVLSQAAEARAARAEQRLLTLKAAQEQRERDLRLSRAVNLGAEKNLERAQETLTQVDRLINQIGTVVVSVSWKIPLGGSIPAIATLARTLPQPPSKRYAQGRPTDIGRLVRDNNEKLLFVSEQNMLQKLSPAEREYIGELTKAPMFVYFFKRPPQEITYDLVSNRAWDLEILQGETKQPDGMVYALEADTLTYSSTTDAPVARLTDAILTVNELKEATVVVELIPPVPLNTAENAPGPVPMGLEVRASGQTAEIRSFRPVLGPDGMPTSIFVGRLAQFDER